MHSRLLLLLAALVAASMLLAAQSPTSPRASRQLQLTVSGAASEHEPPLRQWLERDVAVDRDSLAERVRQWYAARGFLHTNVIVDTSASSGFIIRVDEGPPAVVGGIVIKGLSDDELKGFRASSSLRQDAHFLPGLLERDIMALLHSAERSGRLLATVRVVQLDDVDSAGRCTVSITLEVSSGPEISVASVRVVGNSSTTASTIRRAAGIREGDLWSSNKSSSVVRRLRRTGLFTAVGEPEVELTGQRSVIVTLPVTEGRQNAFDGMIGYLPPATGSGAGTVTGLVDVRLGNLLGTARRLSLRWYQERRGTQEIHAGYREPWVLGSDIDADAAFFLRKHDSLYVRQEITLGVNGQLDESMTLGISFAQASTTPVEGYGATVLASSDQRMYGLRFAYDSRDDALTPRSGAFHAADVQAGRKQAEGIAGRSVTTLQRIRADFSVATSPLQGQTTFLELHGIDVRGSGLDAADLVRLGGATSLRGYREGELLGSRLAWGTLEHRFFFSHRSFIGAFVDGGFVRRPELAMFGLARSEVIRFGYGLALRVDAPVGLIGVSIALGKGDGFGEAKLHVRVQSEF